MLENKIKHIDQNIFDVNFLLDMHVKFYQNLTLSTLSFSIIAFLIIFYLYAREKINFFHSFILIISVFFVFLINSVSSDVQNMHFNTDQYNYIDSANYFRNQSILEIITSIFNTDLHRSNFGAMISLLPFPTLEKSIDLALLNKIFFFIVIGFVSHFCKKDNLFLNILIFLPIFHWHTSFPLKDTLIFFLSFFWIFSLDKKKYFINFFFILLIFLIRKEYAILIFSLTLLFIVLETSYIRYRILTLFILLAGYLCAYYFFDKNVYSLNYSFRGFADSNDSYNNYKTIDNFNLLQVKIIFSFLKSFTVPMNFFEFNIIKLILWLSYFFLMLIIAISIYLIRKQKTLPFVFFFVILVVYPIGIYTLIVENFTTYERIRFPILITFTYLVTKNLKLSKLLNFIKLK